MAERQNLDDLHGKEFEEQPTFLQKYDWADFDISKYIFDVTQDYDSPRYTLNLNGVDCAPVGGLHGITGQSGNGKTMALAMLMAGYLGNQSHGIIYNYQEEKPASVLYIDTEMEPENTMMVNLRVCAALGWDFHTVHPNFNILVLRNCEGGAKGRLKATLKAIYTFKPTVVFLDGIMDVINDFNDNIQCQEFMFDCMSIASEYDINLWLVLHQNPGKDKMVGHAGSFLERKASDLFEVIKKKDNMTGEVEFTIAKKKSRGKDVGDLKFYVDDSRHAFGEPRLLSDKNIEPEPKGQDPIYWAKDQMRSFMIGIITDQSGITTRDLIEAVRNKLNVGQTKAIAFINECANQQVVTRDDNKRYHLSDSTLEYSCAMDYAMLIETKENDEDCPY